MQGRAEQVWPVWCTAWCLTAGLHLLPCLVSSLQTLPRQVPLPDWLRLVRRRYQGSIKRAVTESGEEARGMVLPFEPLNLAFRDIQYR